MSIETLNKILAKLAVEPSRETVLELSFALVEWMGLAPENGNIPRLLSFKTMKLKEYLVTAPRTVQPQLYRLSADGQSIRVRFAVLKKLKKDYVSQLVDNDPGIGSYQGITKNMNLDFTKTSFIPSQPYFIHFVATPKYDRLVLIFNQGDQKRIISFRGRLTHTQHNKILEQWHGISTRKKPEIDELFWKSLDIKEVNKEFYSQIKQRFDLLVSIIGGQKTELPANVIKQFAVRLIGRYVFCWFLKEKGIIPSDLISSSNIRSNDDFYRSTLLKLFFDTLNTKVQDRTVSITNDERFEKIPYLNCGLFDESEEDRFFRDLTLDDWLVDFVSVLESYDFTVDESSSRYQQISVDPEMLGCIFENLLASQNPETEKAANNERKAFGAFYTPREIVDFMVDESLKTYLANSLEIKPEEIDPAFSANPVWPDRLKNRKQDADTALRTIKVLDPVCGSGAFPMGILHGLISLRELTGFQPDTYNLKKEILSNNIYGVDIMPMAVEIARLRAWLSLIVEEDFKPDKPSSNFGIDALPNLDFKFMQGNSLLETYESVKIFDKTILERHALSKTEQLIEQTKKKLDALQRQYIDLHNQNKLKGTEKVILDKELKDLPPSIIPGTIFASSKDMKVRSVRFITEYVPMELPKDKFAQIEGKLKEIDVALGNVAIKKLQTKSKEGFLVKLENQYVSKLGPSVTALTDKDVNVSGLDFKTISEMTEFVFKQREMIGTQTMELDDEERKLAGEQKNQNEKLCALRREYGLDMAPNQQMENNQSEDDLPNGMLRWDITLPASSSGSKATKFDYSFDMEFDSDMQISSQGQEIQAQLRNDLFDLEIRRAKK